MLGGLVPSCATSRQTWTVSGLVNSVSRLLVLCSVVIRNESISVPIDLGSETRACLILLNSGHVRKCS